MRQNICEQRHITEAGRSSAQVEKSSNTTFVRRLDVIHSSVTLVFEPYFTATFVIIIFEKLVVYLKLEISYTGSPTGRTADIYLCRKHDTAYSFAWIGGTNAKVVKLRP